MNYRTQSAHSFYYIFVKVLKYFHQGFFIFISTLKFVCLMIKCVFSSTPSRIESTVTVFWLSLPYIENPFHTVSLRGPNPCPVKFCTSQRHSFRLQVFFGGPLTL